MLLGKAGAIEILRAPWTDFNFPWELVKAIADAAGGPDVPVSFGWDEREIVVYDERRGGPLMILAKGGLEGKIEDLGRLMKRQVSFSLGARPDEIGPLMLAASWLMEKEGLYFRISIRPGFRTKPGEPLSEMDMAFRRMTGSEKGTLVDAPIDGDRDVFVPSVEGRTNGAGNGRSS